MASSAYESVKGGKLSLKLGANAGDRPISKSKKKKKKKKKSAEAAVDGEESGAVKAQEPGGYEIDTGIGHAPDGKKSKKYEELFPVETKRFGYKAEDPSAAAAAKFKEPASREDALDARVKKKADRYCK